MVKINIFVLSGLMIFGGISASAQDAPVTTIPQAAPEQPSSSAYEEITRINDVAPQAKKLIGAGQFGRAQLLYENLFKSTRTKEAHNALHSLIAQVNFAWGQQLEKATSPNWHSALLHYRKAYQHNKSFEPQNAALILGRIGWVLHMMGQDRSAIESFRQARTIFNRIKDYPNEASMLNNLGLCYRDSSQYKEAIESFTLARSAWNRMQQPQEEEKEADLLNNLGMTYYYMNKPQSAIYYYKQALQIQRSPQVADVGGEATTLMNIGLAYDGLKQLDTATYFYKMALPLFDSPQNHRDKNNNLTNKAINLGNIGAYYESVGRLPDSISMYLKAFQIHKTLGNYRQGAITLNNISFSYEKQGNFKLASSYYLKALSFSLLTEDRETQADILSNLMWMRSKRDQSPETAIFFGKQSINLYQSIRYGMRELSSELKDSYIRDRKSNYQKLARLLIDTGRFAEAESVLAMIQQKEFLEFLRNDTRGVQVKKLYSGYRQDEASAREKQNKHMLGVTELAAEEWRLSGLTRATRAQSARLVNVRAQLKKIQSRSDQFIDEMSVSLKRNKIDVKEERDKMRTAQALLREMSGKAAIVWTFVDDQGLDLLLRLPTGPLINLSYHPSRGKMAGKTFQSWLNQKVFDFQNAIRTRKNIDKSARELYSILFCRGELATHLGRGKIKILMWHLSGGLRSLPIAALRDQDGYLATKYQNVVLTAGSSDLNLAHKPQVKWQVLGAGVTQGRTIGIYEFPALAGVRKELLAIVKDPRDGFNQGVFPGRVMYDKNFSAAAFFQALRGTTADSPSPWQVVHIASHFKLGLNAQDSYLVTGSGAPITVAGLKDQTERNSLFAGVELVTLSACDTGIVNGDSVDFLGAVVELAGAKAVLATLWPVADRETAELMSDFYKIQHRHPQAGKSWALDEVQQKFIKRGGRTSHPYYWAGFVLMGNCR